MILAIDIGNTNVKLGVFDDEQLNASFRFAAVEGKTADEYSVNVRNYFAAANLRLDSIDGIVLSSVIPSMNYTFEHMCDITFGQKPLIVSSKLNLGMSIGYENPRELGTDRIAACIAAKERYGAPVIVIDFGTATTVNCVDKKGNFVGGMICPGIRSASDALTNATAKLPGFEFVTPDEVIGRSTVANLQAGLFYGFEGLVKNVILKVRAEKGFADAKVVATGGFANYFDSRIDFYKIDRGLSLYGLYLIYQKNGVKKGL